MATGAGFRYRWNMIRYLVFDIETRVDKALVKQLYDPEDALTLDQAYDKARDQILERSGQQSDFFPIPFHIPIASDKHPRLFLFPEAGVYKYEINF